MTYTFALPTEWGLSITPSQREAAWQSSQMLNYSRQDAYINTLCLNSFLSWFQAEYDSQAKPWLSTQEQPAFAGMLPGAVVLLGESFAHKRILLLPSETSDTEAIEIPQEWIDIPSWAADYILAVQIDPEGEWLTVWGYTTQAAIKENGIYDSGDRTYTLETPHIQRDLNALSQILQYCPTAATQAGLSPTQTLETAQAEQLIERLGNPNLAFPRQAIPFQQWAALLEAPHWRQRLSQQRLGIQSASESIAATATQLAGWFQSVIEDSWQSVEALLGPTVPGQPATSFRNDERTEGTVVRRAKEIELTSNEQSQTVTLLIQLNSESENRLGVVIQLHPSQGETHVPKGMELCLCSPNGRVLQSVQAESQDDYIQLTRFRCPTETRFQVQIQSGDTIIVEPFVA